MLVLHYDHGSSDGVTFLSYDKSFEVSYDESSIETDFPKLATAAEPFHDF